MSGRDSNTQMKQYLSTLNLYPRCSGYLTLVHRYFRKILIAFTSKPFYSKYVQFSDGSIPHKVCRNPKWWPFFKGAIGAMDGSHIQVMPRATDHTVYCNWKGFLSQNCLLHVILISNLPTCSLAGKALQ